MKKTIIIMAVILSSLGLIAMSDRIIIQDEDFSTGEVYIGEYKDSCNCIIHKRFYKNGKLAYQSQSFYAGAIDFEDPFPETIPFGPSISFFENGNIEDYTNYDSSGLIQGEKYENYSNGQHKIYEKYKDGKLISPTSTYESNGKLLTEIFYDSYPAVFFGELYSGRKKFYANGELFMERKIIEGSTKEETIINEQIYNNSKYAKPLTGEQIFKSNCTSCHNIHKDETGPALSGILLRRETLWVKKFINNSGGLIASGDKETNKVYLDWNKTAMPIFLLESSEMDSLISFLGKM